MLLVTSGARAPLLPLSLLLLLLLATLASQLQRGEANPVAQQLDYVKGKGETRADKRGASTPTVKKEGPRDELDEDVASIFDSDPEVSPSGAGSRTSAAGSTTTTTTGKPSGDSLDGGDELVDPLNHAAKSRVSDALADTSTTTTTTTSPSTVSTTAHPSGSSRSDVFDLEERREGNAPIVVLKIHPVSRKNKNGDGEGDDDDDDESAPSAKPTLSPVVDKLVRENKGQTDANGTVTLTLSGNHTFKEIEALNKTGEIVSEVILSTTKLPGRKGRKSTTTTTKRPKTSTTSTRKPAGSRKTTGKQKASTTTTTTRNPKFTIGFDSNYNRTREASGNTTLTIKHEMGGPDTTTTTTTTTTTKNPKSTTTTTTKKPKTTTTTKKPKTTTTTKKPTTTTKKPTTTTTTQKPTTTKKPAQTSTTTKKPWWKIKPPPFTTTTTTTTMKPLNGTAPAAGSCAIRPDCQCDYKELQDSDRMLAVVITNRGGFKGRRLNAKALTSLMKAQASVQQLRDIARQKSISVSTNNTFVLPAGHYYFPTSIRFAGFQAP